MLKISEMAQLANATRRTLIFYDEADVFHPKERSDNGYRYYDYDQLYDLLFILGMKNLGLPLEKIKGLQNNSSTEVMDELLNIQKTIDGKITELSKIQSVVSKKVGEGEQLLIQPYQPVIVKRPKISFWCSQKSVSCTDEEIAELFGSFYKELDALALMDGNQSGFLTDLPDANAKDYPDASFRVIKECSTNNSGKAMPMIEKPAGEYAVVKVGNGTDEVCQGLEKLEDFCQKGNLKINTDLWQMNDNSVLTNRGGSDFIFLEYQLKNK